MRTIILILVITILLMSNCIAGEVELRRQEYHQSLKEFLSSSSLATEETSIYYKWGGYISLLEKTNDKDIRKMIIKKIEDIKYKLGLLNLKQRGFSRR